MVLRKMPVVSSGIIFSLSVNLLAVLTGANIQTFFGICKKISVKYKKRPISIVEVGLFLYLCDDKYLSLHRQ